MATVHLDFATRFAAGPETLVVCVLVAGLPFVLVPAGTAPTTTVASSGTVDPMWWPGSGALTYDLPGNAGISLVKAWLDPDVTWEVYKKTDPIRGDAKVEALTFDLFDDAGAATAVLSGARARVGQLLDSDVTAAATSVPIASSSGVASSGIAWVGREAFVYDGIGSDILTMTTPPAGRGKFGSRARAHRADPTKPALVTFGSWPRYLYGRTTSVWLCRLSSATLYDPTCIFLGTIGPGVQRTASGTRWSIPIDNVVEVLSRKIATRTVSLFGIHHIDTNRSARAPLFAGQRTFLGSTTSDQDDSGWHPNARDFLRDWNDAADNVFSDTVDAGLNGDRVTIRESFGAPGDTSRAVMCWDDPPESSAMDEDGDSVITFGSRRAMPDTVFHFDGKVCLPFPGDAAKIPATMLFVSGAGDARYTLTIPRTAYDDRPLTALVLDDGTQGSLSYVTLTATINTGHTTAAARNRAVLVTARTEASLGVHAEGNVTDALQAAAAAFDALDGGLHEEAIDWTQIAGVLASVGLGGLPSQRAYRFGEGDTILHALSHELRLRGMAFCTRYGRLAAFRTAVFASTEETTATITDLDCVTDNGRAIEPEVIDAAQPMVTSIKFSLRGGETYQWVDDTARSEFGDGAEVECKALEWVPPATDIGNIAREIQEVSQQILGVLAEPYRTVRVMLGPTLLGLQEGDLVLFTHPRVPNTSGTIGIVAATCQVQEVRMQVMGGKGRVQAALRLQEPDIAGYAPSALIAAGGALAASHVLTLDTASGFGATCFARAYRPDGSAATNATDGFTVGDRVRLQQLDARSPATEVQLTITAIDTGANTITVDGFPSAALETAAAAQYGSILVFDDWTVIDAEGATVRDRQGRYVFAADDSDDLLGTADTPKRWAA